MKRTFAAVTCLALLSCGPKPPVQYPVIEHASGEAQVSISWYGLPVKLSVESSLGDGATACMNVAGWIEVCETFINPAEPSEGSGEAAP